MEQFSSLFGVLIDAVFPVAFIFGVGYILGILKLFDKQQALTILKFVGLLGVPAISASVLITTDLKATDFDLSLSYLMVEIFVYLSGALFARFVLKAGAAESLIVGIACSFSNHVLFIYPISEFLFDDVQLQPIKTIIATDVIMLTMSVTALDIVTSDRRTLITVVLKQVKNPALIGLVIGFIILLLPSGPPISLQRTSLFIAQAAAPTALFASGVLLSQKSDARNLKIASLITFHKLALHPIAAVLFIIWWRGYDFDVAQTTMLVTIAPVGLMALTFAPRYNVETGGIVYSMLWTMILSICLIPVLVVLI